MKNMRVFLGLSDICGYYSQLEAGLRERGVSTVFVNAFPEERDYRRFTRPDALGRMIEWLGRRRIASRRGTCQRNFWKVAQGVSLILYALVTLPRFDVYIFASGEGFFFGRGLRLLRLFGRRVITVCHGSDARPPYLSGAVTGTDGPIDADTLAQLSGRIKRMVRRLEHSSDVVISHPLISQFHERPTINWLRIGIPAAPVIPPANEERTASEIVIVHAPTRPGPKGSAEIERAITALQQRGYAIRYERIVGRPNAEVIQAIARCDFVVDELYGDTPMAGFAAEAAFLGKPAIVGMHDYSLLRSFTDQAFLPPSFVCRPEEIEKAVEHLITDANLRMRIGDAARRFVAESWSPAAVAERFQRLIENDIPEDWWFDPKAIPYHQGWGLTAGRLKDVIRAMVHAGGRQALHMSDKPELERRLLDLAGY